MQQSRPLIIAAAATTTLMSITPRTQAVNLACPEEHTSAEPYFEGGFDDNISQMTYFEETTIITTTETTYTTWEDNEGGENEGSDSEGSDSDGCESAPWPTSDLCCTLIDSEGQTQEFCVNVNPGEV